MSRVFKDDFSQQKICWNRIASEKLFALVDENIYIQDSMHFLTGNHLKYLCAVLNSKLFTFLMYLIVGEAAGGNAGNADNVKNLCIYNPSKQDEKIIENLLENGKFSEIDAYLYKVYNINNEEIEYIELF